MKGFMHILEIIIVLLAMFVVLLQFLATPRMDTDWSSVALAAKADDIANAIDASGVNWFDKLQVENAINSTLNMSNTIYSVSMKNVIKPEMRIGCLCFKPGEFSEVKDSLTNNDFSLNGQRPGFTVINITTDDLPFSYDVIVVMDRNISYTNAYKYLANGGGIIEIRDLDVGFTGENGGEMRLVHNRLFGLVFSEQTNPSSGAITFNPKVGLAKSSYYNIYKYFSNIPNSSDQKIAAPHYFTNFLVMKEKINVSSEYPNNAEIILMQGIGSPAAIAKTMAADGKGRTVWVSGGKPLRDDDMSVLLKSLAVWASGEEYELISGVQMINPVKASFYKVYNTDMMQPVEITLTLGTIY